MNIFFRLINLILLVSLIIFLPACSDLVKIQQMSAEIASGDAYPKDDPSKDPKLTPFEKDEVIMGIPPGWKRKAVSSSSDLKFKFVKEDGSGLLVFCYGMFVSRNNLADILQTAALNAIPNARKVEGMWELEVPVLNPRFELYQGSTTSKGVTIPMDINIAWRVNDRFSGCKYGLIYTAASKSNRQNEYEFLAIVRSLR